MITRRRQKGAETVSEWKEHDRQAYVLVATSAYLASLFPAWWEIKEKGDSGQPGQVIRIAGLGNRLNGTNRLIELCVVIAVATLVLAVAAIRSHDRRLLLALRQLAIALVIFNALSVLELWRSMTASFGSADFYLGGHLSYGAYMAIGTSLLVLFSVLVLEAGGLHELFRRGRGGSAHEATDTNLAP
jgi:hypothetical protein